MTYSIKKTGLKSFRLLVAEFPVCQNLSVPNDQVDLLCLRKKKKIGNGKKDRCLVVSTLLASLGAERWAFLFVRPFLASGQLLSRDLEFKEKAHSLLAKAF